MFKLNKSPETLNLRVFKKNGISIQEKKFSLRNYCLQKVLPRYRLHIETDTCGQLNDLQLTFLDTLCLKMCYFDGILDMFDQVLKQSLFYMLLLFHFHKNVI